MQVYISGKITGIEKEAPALFAQGAKEVSEMGYEPLDPYSLAHEHDQSWKSFMREDLKALCDCDGIYMLDNWNDSLGAKAELQLAKSLGL